MQEAQLCRGLHGQSRITTICRVGLCHEVWVRTHLRHSRLSIVFSASHRRQAYSPNQKVEQLVLHGACIVLGHMLAPAAVTIVVQSKPGGYSTS